MAGSMVLCLLLAVAYLPTINGQCQFIICLFDFSSPVCGSDGKTYANKCLLKRADCLKGISGPRIHEIHPGACHDHGGHKPSSCRHCPYHEYKPVCGTDGSTYNSVCELEKEACTKDIYLTITHTGPCHEPSSCPRCPPHQYNPVCGSDDITYNNVCELEKEACTKNKYISVARHGACYGHGHQGGFNNDCRRPCDAYPSSQVCGNDGNTYNNECELNKARCKKHGLSVQYAGPCHHHGGGGGSGGGYHCDPHKPCPPPAYGEVVCASDKLHYRSRCELEKATCRDPSVYEVRCPGTPHPYPGEDTHGSHVRPPKPYPGGDTQGNHGRPPKPYPGGLIAGLNPFQKPQKPHPGAGGSGHKPYETHHPGASVSGHSPFQKPQKPHPGGLVSSGDAYENLQKPHITLPTSYDKPHKPHITLPGDSHVHTPQGAHGNTQGSAHGDTREADFPLRSALEEQVEGQVEEVEEVETSLEDIST